MKKINNKEGFTLVELLAVIVVLAIVMSLAVVAITNVLNNTRRSAYVTEAKSFISGAQGLVQTDELNSMLGVPSLAGGYAPRCAVKESKYVPLYLINLKNGGVTSPYGGAYIKGNEDGATPGVTSSNGETPNRPTTYSYIEIASNGDPNNCAYTYSVFLWDGAYAIGTPSAPIENSAITAASVLAYSGT